MRQRSFGQAIESRIAIALLVGLCCGLGGLGCEQAEFATAEPLSLQEVRELLATGREPLRIVCFGDSITGVYYHTGSQRAYCDLLGIALRQAFPQAQLEMINAGVSGDTTTTALRRMKRDVIARRPHLMVIMFGMNDVAGLSVGKFRRNLQTIASHCLASGSAVVLCTPNSVVDSPARTDAKLSEFAEAVRAVAGELRLPVVDAFRDWQELRRKDEIAWMLQMSDAIHPGMQGHRRFAELIATVVCDRDVSLKEFAPPADALRHTFARLEAGKPLKIVAMPPCDTLLSAALRERFPDAELQITTWPVAGQSLEQLNAWAARIRGLQPDLVVVAVPAAARTADTAAYIRDYNGLLNRSFAFTGRPWDVLPILASLQGEVPDRHLAEARLARQIVLGKDVRMVERGPDDRRPADELLSAWIDAERRAASE